MPRFFWFLHFWFLNAFERKNPTTNLFSIFFFFFFVVQLKYKLLVIIIVIIISKNKKKKQKTTQYYIEWTHELHEHLKNDQRQRQPKQNINDVTSSTYQPNTPLLYYSYQFAITLHKKQKNNAGLLYTLTRQ